MRCHGPSIHLIVGLDLAGCQVYLCLKEGRSLDLRLHSSFLVLGLSHKDFAPGLQKHLHHLLLGALNLACCLLLVPVQLQSPCRLLGSPAREVSPLSFLTLRFLLSQAVN